MMLKNVFGKFFLHCVVCSGVTESAQLVSTTKQMYSWILTVPSNNLNMIFQEVCVVCYIKLVTCNNLKCLLLSVF